MSRTVLDDTIAVSGTATSINAGLATKLAGGPVPSDLRAFMRCEGNAIRWKSDGVAPTTTNGNKILVDETLDFDGEMDKFQAIAVTGSATLQIHFYEDN